MIVLYEREEREFKSLGLGVLRDPISAIVKEVLNGEYELEMEYPVTGSHYYDIGVQKIILVKPNPYSQAQPFRIYSVTKPINRIVTINAAHISYDMSGYTVRPFFAIDLEHVLEAIQNGSVLQSPFIFEADDELLSSGAIEMEIKSPHNMRSLLAGKEGSVLDIYGGEYEFDRFNVKLLATRGSDKKLSIKYRKNMLDLEHESNSDRMYTGVFPFYYTMTTQTTATSKKIWKKVYIVTSQIRFTNRWFANNPEDIIGFLPIVTYIPVQNQSEGVYKDKIFWYIIKDPVEATITNEEVPEWEFTEYWLTTGGGSYTPPVERVIYKIKTPGKYLDKNFIWDSQSELYVTYLGDGFYYDVEDSIIEGYITGTTPNESDWLSKLEGEELVPIVPSIGTLCIIKTEGEYFNKRYFYTGIVYSQFLPTESVPGDMETVEIEEYVDLTTGTDMFIVSGSIPKSSGWLSLVNGGSAITPSENYIYVIKTEGEYFNKKYKWDGETYLDFNGDGIVYIEGLEGDSAPRILTLDLTSYFSEKPSTLVLEQMTNFYILINDIGKIKESISVSFAILSDSDEYSQYKNLEKVELGDIVNVYHDDLKINSTLRVIKTEYDPIINKYLEIELGLKQSSIGDTAIVKGDSVSSLTNDKRYTDYTTVNELIAKNITADMIQAINSNFTKAQIEELQVSKIRCAGIIEASVFDIDKVVSELLVAENANIKEMLKAGSIEVAGIIKALKGSIGGVLIEDQTLYSENQNFKLTKDGFLIAKDAQIKGSIETSNLKVKQYGALKFEDAYMEYIQPGTGADSQLVEMHVVIDDVTYISANDETVITFVVISKVDEYPSPTWFDVQLAIPIKYKLHIFDPETGIIEYSQESMIVSAIFEYDYYEQYFYTTIDGKISNVLLDGDISPKTFTEIKSTGNPIIGVNANLEPRDESFNFNLGSSGRRWNDIYAKNGTINTSDKNLKKDINYDISKYEDLFKLFKPVSYKFKDSSSERTHLGLISQDIMEALITLNIDPKEFAGYIRELKPECINKEDPSDDDYIYGIRYSELHALQIHMIQKLLNDISELKDIIMGIK